MLGDEFLGLLGQQHLFIMGFGSTGEKTTKEQLFYKEVIYSKYRVNVWISPNPDFNANTQHCSNAPSIENDYTS